MLRERDRFLPKLSVFAAIFAVILSLAAASVIGQFGSVREGRAVIVFVDNAVRGSARLTEGLSEGAIIHHLAADEDGFEQINRFAARYDNISEIHVISHGERGSLQLGNAKYTAQSLRSDAGPALAQLSGRLTPDADILLYGCDIGGGPHGPHLVEKLAALTGADIAASDNTTGHFAAGGDWRFEVQSGEIESDILVSMETQQSWPHILANTTLDWATRPFTNFAAAATDVAVVDSITITSSGTQVGSRTSTTHQIDPALTYDGFPGVINSGINATTDNGSVQNITQYVFSEPVYNLTFTVVDVDGGPTLNFRDEIRFGTDTGAFPTAVTGSNVTYNAATGIGQAINGYCSGGAGNVPNCLLTPTFAGPVSTVTVAHVAAGASGSNPSFQRIVIDDLTFNTPPDATDNSNSTNESTSVGGNMISDDDGSGIDSDNQDANSALTVLSVDGNPVPVGGLVINTASGGILTVQQDGSYTFDPNGGYEALGLGQSTIETFTYIVQDAEGLSNNDGSATDSVATLSITINGEADYDFTVSKVVDIGNVTTLPTTLNYTITVTNTGDTGMTGVTPVDTLVQDGTPTAIPLTGPSGDGGTIGTIDVGEVWTYTGSHVVTQAQMDNANDLVNGVVVTTTEMGATSRSDSATTTITANPDLTVTKTADDTTDVVVGQVITYTYEVENTGNQTITAISMSDAHGGSGPAPVPGGETLTTDSLPLGDSTDGGANGTWDTLAPGDIVTFTATYTVTQNDVDTLQ
ncbi:MAG: DUF4347 domain-containing protein [Ruegeria sp.]